MCIYLKGGICTIGINRKTYPGQKVIRCGPDCSYYSDPEHPTTLIVSNSKCKDTKKSK